MLKRMMVFLFKGKRSLVSLPMLLILGVVGWQTLRYWWYHGYSKGSYQGIVRKVSYKGPPYCKYVSIEIVVGGATVMQPVVKEFTLDDDSDGNPLFQKFKDAEKTQKSILVDYRQDLKKWWACAETEYYAVGIE